MTRIPGFRFFALWLSLIILSGCNSIAGGIKPEKLKAMQTDQKLLDSIEKVRQSDKARLAESEAYHRQLALNFEQSDIALSSYQQQLVQLFFQTIPQEHPLNIVITVAPVTDTGDFDSLQQAWQRLQNLKEQVKAYSSSVKLIYKPELSPDTATLQVVRGDDV